MAFLTTQFKLMLLSFFAFQEKTFDSNFLFLKEFAKDLLEFMANLVEYNKNFENEILEENKKYEIKQNYQNIRFVRVTNSVVGLAQLV